MSKKALKKAIHIAGSQAALAKLIGKRQSHVWNWLHRDNSIPPSAAILIDTALDSQVTKSQLCPEIFGDAA